jgi:hypothetical protein
VGLAQHWGAITLRRRRRELVAIVLLLGILGGVSLCALAGARRTQSSYPRFLRASHASTMAIDPGQYDPEVDAVIAAFPEVVRSTTYVAFTTGPLLADGRPDFLQDFETIGTFDGRFFTMDRFAPTRGRLPDVDRDDEIAVNETAADLYGYQVGQHLDLGTYSNEQLSSETFFEDPPPPVIRTRATIVGIGLFTDEVLQDDTNRTPLALVTPAFSKEAAAYAGYAWQGLTLRRGDADVESVKAQYMALLEPGSPQFFRVTSVDTFHAEQAVRPLSLALAAFGAIAGFAALVLVGQAVSRHLRHAGTDHEVLRSFGASPRTLAAAGLIGPLLALALGTLLAVGLAFAASPLLPLGPARRVEIASGLDADWAVLGIGAATLLVLLVSVAVVASIRELPHRRSATRGIRRSRVVGAASGAGMPPSAVAGLRLAFEPGDGATVVPVRSVMIAGTIAIVTLVSALTFGASFRSLLDSPDLYGWSWDVAIYDQSGYGTISLAGSHELLDGRPEIAGWSGAFFGADSIDGLNLPLLGMEADSAVVPPLIAGRMITSADEVVLGSATAEALRAVVGDEVHIGVSDPRTLRVVGIATLPTIGVSHGAHTSLGVGALVVPDLVPGFDRIAVGEGPPGSEPSPVGPPVVFVRYAKGADESAALAVVSNAAASIGASPGSAFVIGPQRPAEIVSSSEVGGAPALLAAALGVATAASLTIALAASVRRRRHELALLRSLGFTRRQLAATVAWQATATIGVGLLLGVPVGVALGRTLWRTFAAQLDVVPHATVPVMLLVALVAVALAVANAAAALPARVARRVRPAAVLRAE